MDSATHRGTSLIKIVEYIYRGYILKPLRIVFDVQNLQVLGYLFRKFKVGKIFD